MRRGIFFCSVFTVFLNDHFCLRKCSILVTEVEAFRKKIMDKNNFTETFRHYPAWNEASGQTTEARRSPECFDHLPKPPTPRASRKRPAITDDCPVPRKVLPVHMEEHNYFRRTSLSTCKAVTEPNSHQELVEIDGAKSCDHEHDEIQG